jgi:hypothetical protein
MPLLPASPTSLASLADHPLSPESQPKLGGFSLQNVQKTDKFDLDLMDQAELLALRDKIDGKITGINLSEINLPKEALVQFQRAKRLQEKASEATDIPMNQQAQVQNSLGSVLKDLAKIQMSLYDSEYLKRLKAATVKVVQTLPKEQQDQFFELMEEEALAVDAEMGA